MAGIPHKHRDTDAHANTRKWVNASGSKQNKSSSGLKITNISKSKLGEGSQRICFLPFLFWKCQGFTAHSLSEQHGCSATKRAQRGQTTVACKHRHRIATICVLGWAERRLWCLDGQRERCGAYSGRHTKAENLVSL